MSAAAPPRTIDPKSQAKKKKPAAPAAKKAARALTGNIPTLTPEQIAASGTLNTAYSKSGGRYYWPPGVPCTGLPEGIVFKDKNNKDLTDKVFKGQAEGTHCVGFTFWVFMKEAAARGLLKDMTNDQIRELQKIWFGNVTKPVLGPDGKQIMETVKGKDGQPVMVAKKEWDPKKKKMVTVMGDDGKPVMVEKQVGKTEHVINDYFWQQGTLAMEQAGLGKRITNPADAQPGDFVQLWREKNNNPEPVTGHWAGHSVVFVGWVTNDKGERVGMKYRTSNQGGNLGPDGKMLTTTEKDKNGKDVVKNVDGIGDRVEYFKGAKDAQGNQLMAPGQSLPVDPSKLSIGRMHSGS